MGVIVGTAGHIDHGKSSLMIALTGRDPDRLKEEKQRGITIELGYVFLEDAEGRTVSFIDVPGHEKFIRTMVAGVSTVDCFLLVVSADEGVMPQTREHLDILRLLEVNRGIVALSKCDLVDQDLQDLAEEEVREALRGTPAEEAPVIRVSAVTGLGMAELKDEIFRMVQGASSRSSEGRFRLPVDRVFSLKGFGTVVCGTGLSGAVKAGDTVEVQPGGRQYRVRELGVNDHRKAPVGVAGDRIALNLTGLDKEDVQRGAVLGEPGWLRSLTSLDTRCTVLPGEIDLHPRQRVRIHLGTAEVMARAIPVSGKPIPRGGEGFVHFQLEHPVVAVPGDRFVFRRYSPVLTMGGGVVLDTGTPKVRARFREVRLTHLELLNRGDLADVLMEAMEDSPDGSLLIPEFISSSGSDPAETQQAALRLCDEGRAVRLIDGKSERLVLAPVVADLDSKVSGAVETVHRSIPLAPGIASAMLARKLPAGTPPWLIRHVLSKLIDGGVLTRRGDYIASAHQPVDLSGKALSEAERITGLIDAAGFEGTAMPVPGVRREDIEALMARDMVICLDADLLTTPKTLRRVMETVAEAFGAGGFRLGEFREALGTSRKFALMWAELLDNRGLTRREEEVRKLCRP
ncbi:MAG: selenocysteine-specific translation elongation factor [Candidatus Fermentibacteraceae bacterium]